LGFGLVGACLIVAFVALIAIEASVGSGIAQTVKSFTGRIV
jgi:hypothetical protein